MTQQDERELHRLTDMLREIDASLQKESPLREGLKIAGLALSVAFIHHLRPEIERLYAGLDSNRAVAFPPPTRPANQAKLAPLDPQHPAPFSHTRSGRIAAVSAAKELPQPSFESAIGRGMTLYTGIEPASQIMWMP
jgi:hypothetical protein